jgi:hypothetical protein
VPAFGFTAIVFRDGKTPGWGLSFRISVARGEVLVTLSKASIRGRPGAPGGKSECRALDMGFQANPCAAPAASG